MTQTSVDYFSKLRLATRARIGLGRSGDALPTSALLDFQLAHAHARDAVHSAMDCRALMAELPGPCLMVKSAARDRWDYLQRPDLGRMLSPDSRQALRDSHSHKAPWNLVFVIADGLSARAVKQHAVPTIAACQKSLPADWSIGPYVLAEQGRVAIGDDIATELGAEMVAILIGERPGLSVAQSLGIYLTYAPAGGRLESERNCISNIHAHGLSYAEAGAKLAWLAQEAKSRGVSGIALKDEAPPLVTADDKQCLEHVTDV